MLFEVCVKEGLVKVDNLDASEVPDLVDSALILIELSDRTKITIDDRTQSEVDLIIAELRQSLTREREKCSVDEYLYKL